MSDSASRIEAKGYNRGLILGFTMAESLLLVIFCLLLVAAAVIAAERQKAADAIAAQAKQAEQMLKSGSDREEVLRLRRELEAATRQIGLSATTKRPEDWRELVVAKDTLQVIETSLSAKGREELEKKISQLQSEGATAQVARLKAAALEQSVRELTAKNETLEKQLALSTQGSKPHEWPPIISLSEANGNYFRSGSAELTRAFGEKLNGSISSQIADNLESYGANIVEVIGHTDEQPVSRPTSNMDLTSINALNASAPITSLEPGDNAGLGLARAIAVANVLRANPALKGVTVLPLSGAQLILPGDVLTNGVAGNLETRRRIEIRIRRRDAGLN